MTGTSDRDLTWFLERTPRQEHVDPDSFAAGEWNRRSVEAFIASTAGNARSLRSHGALRLHGEGVRVHSAELGQVGLIATAWQKAVSATGAALEQVRSLRGALPADITQRTTLLLNASPVPGSIVLGLEPQSPPLDEVEPDGNVSMLDRPRPLADQACAALIKVLADAGEAQQADADGLATALRELGPRVGSALAQLAQAIHRSNITVDARWAEPDASTVSASISPSAARRIRDFVAGRGLDAEEQYLIGALRTVSDREKWLVELLDGEVERMSATELAPEEIAKWRVGDQVSLRVRVALREQPDGVTRRSHTILELTAIDD